MIIIPTKYFKKQSAKLPKPVKVKLAERIKLFMSEPRNITLNNHELHGKYEGYRSINITGDYRMVFEELADNVVRVIDVDTHPNLY